MVSHLRRATNRNDVTVCGLREAIMNHEVLASSKRSASEFNRRATLFDEASSTVV
jgi:hypothetical protein